ncbi:hypothetical protein [Aliikangiella coralliicola]|uniref:Uncharacterized protein n=1 Tax=Aliikangiella coralliicola TaxID=2592383 RepID=A0A545UIU7_9GAMM|nr:hypothetical protein [Aliikangiella coralliicola]TQV89353.1 hypothetical protein FLL46_00275 [Aliikangiella coralliicola]
MSKQATKAAATKTTAGSSKRKKTQNGPEEKLLAIRDLLFGEQVAQLESSINDQHKQLSRRLDNLESLVKKKTEQINKKIQATADQINDLMENNRLEHVSQESILEEKLSALTKSLNEFQQLTENGFGDAQSELNSASKAIYRSIDKEVKKLSDKIDKKSKELSNNKADRKTLATMLESMAVNLNQSQV